MYGVSLIIIDKERLTVLKTDTHVLFDAFTIRKHGNQFRTQRNTPIVAFHSLSLSGFSLLSPDKKTLYFSLMIVAFTYSAFVAGISTERVEFESKHFNRLKV